MWSVRLETTITTKHRQSLVGAVIGTCVYYWQHIHRRAAKTILNSLKIDAPRNEMSPFMNTRGFP